MTQSSPERTKTVKSSYTFKATPDDTDYVRICRENHQAAFLVVRSEGATPVTFVRVASDAFYRMRLTGIRPGGKIDVPPVKEPAEPRGAKMWLVYDGDFSRELAPKVLTTVEVY